MVDARISPGGGAIWPSGPDAPVTARREGPPRTRPLHAVRPSADALHRRTSCRRAPEWPAHAPGRPTPWHQPSPGDDRVRERADALDLDRDLVARPEVAPARHSDAGRRARGDQIARLELDRLARER